MLGCQNAQQGVASSTTVRANPEFPRALGGLNPNEGTTYLMAPIYSKTTSEGFLKSGSVEKVDCEGLKQGYGDFRDEAQEVFPSYEARLAWVWLFPKITLVLCFLHSVLKIGACCRGWLRREVLDRV